MEISSKIVSILILSAFLTAWQLIIKPMYDNWILSQGGAIGLGETYLGYVMVMSVASIVTFIIVRKLKSTASGGLNN